MEELAVLDKIKPVLEEGLSARTIEFTPEEEKIVKSLFLLTTKPVLYVANVSEDEVADQTTTSMYNKFVILQPVKMRK